MTIKTAMTGTNSIIFPEILSMYVPSNSTVADVTFGNGVFWKNIPKDRFKLLKSDIISGTDLRKLPYDNNSIDALVLDPPYRNHGGHLSHSLKNIEFCYKISTVKNREGIKELYTKGIIEAKRVLKKNSILIVKCQDEICGGRQCWNHIEILQFAEKIGFVCEDIFILIRRSGVTVKRTQWHAAKNHSYFLVFKLGRGLKTSPHNAITSSLTDFQGEQQ